MDFPPINYNKEKENFKMEIPSCIEKGVHYVHVLDVDKTIDRYHLKKLAHIVRMCWYTLQPMVIEKSIHR